MKFIFFVALFIFSSCHDGGDETQLATVFGEDNRRVMPTQGTPFQQIGLVYLNKKKICTGTLVGRSTVLTSAHCILQNRPSSLKEVYFYVGYRKEEYTDVSGIQDIYVGTRFPLKERANDWAFLTLKTPLGARYGALPTRIVPDEKLRGLPVGHGGYSADFVQRYGHGAYDPNCRVTFGYNKLLRHNCDSLTGSSGGPLWIRFNRQFYLIGIHVASAPCVSKEGTPFRCPVGVEYNHNIANFGVDAESFLNKLRQLESGSPRNLIKLYNF